MKVPSIAYQEDGGIYSAVKKMFIDHNYSSPSCTRAPQSGSSGVRGTSFIHSSGTCSEEPAVYVKEGAIDLALNDSDLPLVLEEDEVTRDLMNKERADQELKDALQRQLYKSEPYILKWHTDNCIMNGVDTALCYYDDNHTQRRQNEERDGDYYNFYFYTKEFKIIGRLYKSPLYKSYITAYKRINDKLYSGSFNTTWGNGASDYSIDTYDANNTLRERSTISCANLQSTDDNNFKYDQYWDADGNLIYNVDGSPFWNEVRNLDPSMCPTYEQINAMHNFDWSQSRLYQMEMTGS